jgi:hypothetical protein
MPLNERDRHLAIRVVDVLIGDGLLTVPSSTVSFDQEFLRVREDDGRLNSSEAARLVIAASLLTLLLLSSLLFLRPHAVVADDWTVRCEDGWVAHIKGGASPGEIGLTIDRQVEPDDWGVVLQRHDRIDDRSMRVLRFEARADKARDAVCVVRDFAPPWDNLGLNEPIRLTPQWRPFAFSFVPKSASSMVATEWLVGSSAIPIEIRGYSLTKQPSPAGRTERSTEASSMAGGP